MILILTPLSLEQKFLVKGFEKRGLTFDKDTTSGALISKNPNFFVAQGGHGKTQFGIQCQHWLQKESNIKKVFTVGAAGGLSKDVNIFDLIVVENIIEHDYNMSFSPKNKKPQFPTSPLLFDESHNYSFNVLRGSLASGDEDIITTKRAEELFEETKALAVAWESAGGARAARFNNIPYFEVRGITDDARSNVVSDFKNNLEKVMDQIAEFLIPLLK